MSNATTKSRRGFAAMSPEKRAEIASKGGSSVKPENRAYSRSRELASTAGRKGGEAPRTPKIDIYGTHYDIT